MSELEELPSWAGRSTDEPQPEPGRLLETPQAEAQAQPQAQMQPQPEQVVYQDPEPRRRRPWLMALVALFGILALLGMGALGYLLASSQNDDGTETAADGGQDDGSAAAETDDAQLGSEEVAGADGSDAGTDDGADATDEETVTVAVDGEADGDAATDETTDTTAATDSETGDDTGDATGDATAADGGSDRQAIFKGGKVYLSGAVPSEEIGQVIEQKAAAVVGPDNVVNEYTIDPTAVIEPGSSAPLYVEDVVLFEFNSVEIATPFLPILDLGTLLLRQNPQASVTVVTRTDAVGSEEVNLEVSRKRAQAVINYWLGKGVSADQINADPRGEEGASEDDDEQTAALNRRAEFIITGLLD